MFDCGQVTGIVFFTDDVDAVPGLVPNVILFVIELFWERLGLRGVQKESAFSLFVFWALSVCLPAFIIAVIVVSGEAIESYLWRVCF